VQVHYGRERILSAIQRRVHPDSITVEDGLAIIAVVGRGMVKAKGTAAKVFDTVSAAGVNIKMIDQGSSELNIILGIEEADFEKTINAIYSGFVNK
jgi:aspartate kinase